eukprot:TRINITY_DN2777_c0_g1_i1.p2 TRINITY_DN2777_c0_g1~~TRINITY_DN2777_c0_g1_i1.p2  ORF type:complete len:62 (-),score=4.39 TRINITY_DN2777_c0_g1_i1:211-396(-)
MIRVPGMAKLECPSCSYEFCFNCDSDKWHDGLNCDQHEYVKSNKDDDDSNFSKYRNKHTNK